MRKKNRQHLKGGVAHALKWSAFTEVGSKFISPLTSMILSRLLAPEVFGIVATVVMITSFADIFTNGGFQQYLIQHEFEDGEELDQATNVAFWSNLALSFSLWFLIALFSASISLWVGNEGYGHVIAVACASIPLTAFTSIHAARFRRDFSFKSLFWVRITQAVIPLVITVPLALLGMKYWALIIGTIAGNIYSVLALAVRSNWRPRLQYNFRLFREMLAYSLWTMLDSLAVWSTSWFDTFIVSNYFSLFHVGLYKNSLNIVNALMAVITSSLTPVLFASLSRKQNKKGIMASTFLSAQRLLAMLILPLGFGIFMYRDLATQIMLGSQWEQAANIIGIWALTSVFRVCFVSINSELYRASGKPRISFILQIVDLLIIIPVCLVSIQHGFWALVYSRAVIRLDLVLPNCYILYKMYGINVWDASKKLFPLFLSVLIMVVTATGLRFVDDSPLWQIVSIGLCIVTYTGMLCLFPTTRRQIVNAIRSIVGKKG